MPPEATVTPDSDLCALGPQVCPGTRRPRGRAATQRRKGEFLGLLWENLGLNAGTTWPHNEYVFTTLLRRTGLRRIRFHDLRHSTATLLLEQVIELAVIKELLGHAHIGVTASVYAHIKLRLQRQAIDTLGNAFSPTDDPPATAVIC